MTIANLEEIRYSHPEVSNPLGIYWEFGQERIRESIAANSKVRITITAPTDRVMFIFRYRFGDFTANVINFRWNNVENIVEKDILIGTELLNFDTRPMPLILVRNSEGRIMVNNTSAQAETFEMVYDYVLVHKESVERFSQIIKRTSLGSKAHIG